MLFFLGAMMWCWVVQSTVRHDKLGVRWKGAQLLHIHIHAQLLHIRILAKNVVNLNLELRKGSFFVDLLTFGSLVHQVWPPLCYNIKKIQVFNRLKRQVLWRIQITKLCSNTFLYDASYNRGGELQKRMLKIRKMKYCQELKSRGEKYRRYGHCPIMLFY